MFYEYFVDIFWIYLDSKQSSFLDAMKITIVPYRNNPRALISNAIYFFYKKTSGEKNKTTYLKDCLHLSMPASLCLPNNDIASVDRFRNSGSVLRKPALFAGDKQYLWLSCVYTGVRARARVCVCVCVRLLFFFWKIGLPIPPGLIWTPLPFIHFDIIRKDRHG